MLHEGRATEIAYSRGCPQEPPRIGLPVAVWGTREENQPTITASELDLGPLPLESISSYGIIEAILSQSPQALTVRADGSIIRIPASAHLEFKEPLRSLKDVTTNVWLDYKGKQQADGTVLAGEARFKSNLPNPRAQKTREHTNYDPTRVTKPGSIAGKLVLGPNAMEIPTWHDAAMQARVAAVGKRLVPGYQRQLPDSDETKIDFRFYVTKGDRWLRSVVALPSGIILVPHQVVDHMQNDSQLATVIADAIAVEIEAQDDRMMKGVRPTGKQFTAGVAEDAGIYGAESIVPGLDYAFLGDYALGTSSARRTLEKQFRQSARVSLSLMHEAGYDIGEAPIAWRRLAEKKGRPLADTALPKQSVNLYRDLSTTWNIAPPAPEPGSEKSSGK